MTPAEFMEHLDAQIAESLKIADYEIENIAQRIVREVRDEALGIETDSWGHLKKNDGQLHEQVLKEIQPEMDIFRKKIQDRVKSRASMIDKYPFKTRIDNMINNACGEIIREETNSIQSGLADLIKERVNDHMGEWKAMIRMNESLNK